MNNSDDIAPATPSDLIEMTHHVLDNLRSAAQEIPSRELSLAITNVEQGILWLHVVANRRPSTI